MEAYGTSLNSCIERVFDEMDSKVLFYYKDLHDWTLFTAIFLILSKIKLKRSFCIFCGQTSKLKKNCSMFGQEATSPALDIYIIEMKLWLPRISLRTEKHTPTTCLLRTEKEHINHDWFEHFFHPIESICRKKCLSVYLVRKLSYTPI